MSRQLGLLLALFFPIVTFSKPAPPSCVTSLGWQSINETVALSVEFERVKNVLIQTFKKEAPQLSPEFGFYDFITVKSEEKERQKLTSLLQELVSKGILGKYQSPNSAENDGFDIVLGPKFNETKAWESYLKSVKEKCAKELNDNATKKVETPPYDHCSQPGIVCIPEHNLETPKKSFRFVFSEKSTFKNIFKDYAKSRQQFRQLEDTLPDSLQIRKWSPSVQVPQWYGRINFQVRDEDVAAVTSKLTELKKKDVILSFTRPEGSTVFYFFPGRNFPLREALLEAQDQRRPWHKIQQSFDQIKEKVRSEAKVSVSNVTADHDGTVTLYFEPDEYDKMKSYLLKLKENKEIDNLIPN